MIRFAWLLGLVAIAGESLAACPCGTPPEPFDAYGEAAAVFVAELLAVSYAPSRMLKGGPEPIVSSRDVIRRRMLVTHAWKGMALDTIEVYSRDDPHSSCGERLFVGERYLIYASRADSIHLYDDSSVGGKVGPLLPPGLRATRICALAETLYDLNQLGPPSAARADFSLPSATVDALVGYLANEPRSLWSACEALVALGVKDPAVRFLKAALRHGDPWDKLRAVGLLGKLGPAGRQAIPELADIIASRGGDEHEEYLQQQALEAMEKMGLGSQPAILEKYRKARE